MNVFDENKVSRGGHLDNPGKFSTPKLVEVQLGDLVVENDTDEAFSALDAAVRAGSLNGEVSQEGDSIVFRDASGFDFRVCVNEDTAWAYEVGSSELEAEYVDVTHGRVGPAVVEALSVAVESVSSRAGWVRSVGEAKRVAEESGATATMHGDAFVVNPGVEDVQVTFDGFEARDDLHDGDPTVNVHLSGSGSFLLRDDSGRLRVHRGFDLDPLDDTDASEVFAEVRDRSGLDRFALSTLLSSASGQVATRS